MGLDKKDKLILSLLQEDSTLSVKEISEKIGLTFTPTYERIKNLEKQGVVEKICCDFEPRKTWHQHRGLL